MPDLAEFLYRYENADAADEKFRALLKEAGVGQPGSPQPGLLPK
ncbi:MAG: hypothetical protein ACREFB_16115 [Stellaceae bacterium]